MRLNRHLKSGDILTNNMLYSPELIKFGDVIKTQIESGGIFIEFNARALKAGKLNEIIQLENLNSKKCKHLSKSDRLHISKQDNIRQSIVVTLIQPRLNIQYLTAICKRWRKLEK